jgi:hypothetical protein
MVKLIIHSDTNKRINKELRKSGNILHLNFVWINQFNEVQFAETIILFLQTVWRVAKQI